MNILVPVDFSDMTGSVAHMSEILPGAHEGRIVVMHVLPARHRETPERLADMHPKEERQLSALVDSLQRRGFRAEGHLTQGDPVHEILDATEQHEIDMVIMGSHGHNALYELVIGSVSEGVLHRTDRPVLIVPGPKRKKPHSHETEGIHFRKSTRTESQHEHAN